MKNPYYWFVPHKKNNYHPIALRPLGLIIFLIIYLSLPPIYNVTEAKKFQVLGYASNVSISDLHTITNQTRTNYGIPALTLNTQLNSAAAAKASDMIADNYWAHVAPDGKTPWYFIANSGYSYSVAAENLANGFDTSQYVVNGWLNSPSHKANLINKDYKDVGYAVINGILQGSETTLVVAMYATKTTPNPPAPAPTSKAPKAPIASDTKSQTPTQPKQTANNATPTTQTPPVREDAQESAQGDTEDITSKEPESADTNAIIDNQDTTIKTSNNDNRGIGDFVKVAGIFTSNSVKKYGTFNWSKRVSILLLCTLILLFVLKHTIIWRQQKRGARQIWLRSHPLGQAMLLVGVLILTIASSAGAVL